MDSPLESVPLRSFFFPEDSVEAELDRLLEKLNLYKMENEQLKTLLLEKNASMKPMPECLLYMEKKVATVE